MSKWTLFTNLVFSSSLGFHLDASHFPSIFIFIFNRIVYIFFLFGGGFQFVEKIPYFFESYGFAWKPTYRLFLRTLNPPSGDA